MTLIELIFTVVILAVLIAIAAPSFRDASLSGRLTATANSLLGSVQVARSEAIKANATTTLCASSTPPTCAGSGDWDQGWVVLDAGGNVIHAEPAQPAGYKVIENGGIFVITFQPIGLVSTAATFTICREDPIGSQERVLNMTGMGIPSITMTETGDCDD